MARIVRLTESELIGLVNKVVNEQVYQKIVNGKTTFYKPHDMEYEKFKKFINKYKTNYPQEVETLKTSAKNGDFSNFQKFLRNKKDILPSKDDKNYLNDLITKPDILKKYMEKWGNESNIRTYD